MTAPRHPADVRMRGFTHRSTVAQAWDWIGRIQRLETETVALELATGRVLATGVKSEMDVPPFDRSAMDGFAILAEETAGASEYNPLPFTVVGESRPGHASDVSVQPGTAVRIMTGAPLPDGADAVVPAEHAHDFGAQVELTMAVAVHKHVGRRGEDVAAGQEIVPAGRRLRPQDVAVIASLGQPSVHVVRRPRVRLIITGNELVLPGESRAEHQIFEANSFLLRGLIERDGGVLVELLRLPDQRDAIRDSLSKPGADVILISGGSSVGQEDHAPTLIAELGELSIHGLAMRPSSPAGMGRIGSAYVFLLPGNPISCLCAYDFFAGRAARLLGGLNADWPHRRISAPLLRKISSAAGRVDYCRVRVTNEGIEPLALSGASILSSAVRADGFVFVPESSEGAAAGSMVDVYLW